MRRCDGCLPEALKQGGAPVANDLLRSAIRVSWRRRSGGHARLKDLRTGELIFEHVSAWRTAVAYEQIIHPGRQSEAKTTSSQPLKFLKTDKDDGDTMH